MKTTVVEIASKEFKRINKLYNGNIKKAVENGKYTFSNVLEENESVYVFDVSEVKDLEEYGAGIKGDEVTIYADEDDALEIATGIAYAYKNAGLLKTDDKSKESKPPVITNADGEEIKVKGVAGIRNARRLANLPGNHLTPSKYADEIRWMFGSFWSNVSVTVLSEAELRKLGFNTLLSVAQGSDEEPKVVVIEYRGKDLSNDFDIAYVGKGVTFDSGGISLKPGSKMHEMKMDMGGSAAVVGAMQNIAEAELPVNVVAIVGLVENMPSGSAIKPGDVVTSLAGKTVENHNTDAEGRLVLCDLLTYIQNEYSVNKVVDVATLTGAILVALADQYAGLFTNSSDFANDIITAGKDGKERYWRMPMGKEFAKQLDSNVADMKNIGNGHPGSTTAAEFLYKFINEDVAWAHLDIAGTGMVGGEGTGFGVRTLANLAQSVCESYDIDDDMKY